MPPDQNFPELKIEEEEESYRKRLQFILLHFDSAILNTASKSLGYQLSLMPNFHCSMPV